jgi:hypothetical protein
MSHNQSYDRIKIVKEQFNKLIWIFLLDVQHDNPYKLREFFNQNLI